MTDKKRLRVIILSHGGAEALLELLSKSGRIDIVGVFVETALEPKRTAKEKIARSIKYDGFFRTAKKFSRKIIGKTEPGNSYTSVQNDLEQCCANLKLPFHRVENYHAASTIERIKNTSADLGILYGTNIIKEPVFSIPRLGSINIHQGLAPYYRGGPTVFWELFNGEKEVGITVHFVAPQVDTGDIVLQKTVPLQYDFAKFGTDFEPFMETFRASLKAPSAKLLAEAVDLIAANRETRIRQDISLGKRYRLPVKTEKDELVRRLKTRFEV